MRNGYFTLPFVILLFLGFALTYQLAGLGLYLVLGKEGNLDNLLIINSITQLTVLLFASVGIAALAGQRAEAVFRLEGIPETPFGAYLLAYPIMMATQMVGAGAAGLWQEILKQFSVYAPLYELQKAASELLSKLGGGQESNLLFLVVTIGMVPALAEEFVFRGLLFTNIERSGNGRTRPVLAILVTSLLFAALHLQPLTFPGLFVLGLVLAYLSYRTNNILVSAAGHFFNNATLVVLAFFFAGQESEELAAVVESDDVGLMRSIYMLILGLPALLALLFLFRRITEDIQARRAGLWEIISLNQSRYYPEDAELTNTDERE